MVNQNYPGVSLRVKAVMTDSLFLVILIVAVTYLFGKFENVPDYIRTIAFVFIFILYDPTLTSAFGGTVGHMIFGIRVKRAKNQQKNILFPLAIVRFIVKAFLGWISLLTVSGNNKGRAIHDFIVGSVVVYADEKAHVSKVS